MWWRILKEAATNWSRHKDARQGAALAYYSVFSLGPIIVIAIAVAGLLFGYDAVNAQVMSSIKDMLGETGAKAVEAMLAGANRPAAGIIATILGIGALLFAAIGVVVQLKDALNVVWEVEESKDSGVWHFARNYVLSFAAVLTLGFLLLVSLLVSAGLAAAGKYAATYLPESLLHVASMLVSFVVVMALFAVMFKWLPDVSVGWRDVWAGAFLTALFFEIGKAAIGFYIGKQGLESTYGAAASIVVVLIWVYYTSQIILIQLREAKWLIETELLKERWLAPSSRRALGEFGMDGGHDRLTNLLGRSALEVWGDMPRDIQEALFETAMKGRHA